MEDELNLIRSELSELNKRVGVMISVLFRMVPEGKPGVSLKEQIRVLSELGMRPKDIASILGRTSTYVNKELAGIRKGKVGSKGPKP